MNSRHIVAVVPAAGIGTRMQSDIPKQYLTLHGKTILEHTLERLSSHSLVDSVVVAIHPDDRLFFNLPISRHVKISTVTGGSERSESVSNALQALPHDSWALVHDAARPCVCQKDITRLIDTEDLSPTIGAILASPVSDTLKRGSDGYVSDTVDRSQLWRALTPQFFHAHTLLNAYRQAHLNHLTVTDEASAMELAGHKVKLINGHAGNIKITHPDDLSLAAFYLQQESD
ncbi:2-C-methyl-D-erythritol 4-phosphate cytidylyltransferase [Alteromonas sediminis]|uniref:2-C-methyl-D-erythritol 4-phosphate cytidylyltransferase n=1 Tax=Alteromonas sediminis TaxID=2259342 RepID=A0A3N5YAY2_9ALTE|nr:2-C-methyl-D-erythritol 4-phosphate cytidylyltransferase [Alteromonas sediminis]RPJ66045.1 2-C-methyl-D-erythritol 4-phosphate cytidylyltransferase [Alteromonas sediminis]